MAEIDTSSYPKPGLPVSPLDMAGKLGGLQQQKQQIDQAKLDQANQALGYMTRAMGSLGPNASKEDYAKAAQNAVDQGLVPQQQENIFLQHLQNAPDAPSFYKQFMSAAADHAQQLAIHTGINTTKNDGSTDYQGKTDVLTGGFTPTTKLPVQQPPSTPNVDNSPTLPNGARNPNYLQPGYVGPSGPPGVVPARTPLPVERPPAMAPAGPIAGVQGPSANFKGSVVSANAEPPTVTQRIDAAFPNRVATGAAPGVASAIEMVGRKSGEDYATDLTRAKNFKADLYPAQAALEGIKELGPKNVGPGTEALNNVKSAIITWLPNVDQKTIDNVATFEQTRKYLTQIARSNGTTGTNDQLAAAFEANPSIKMSGAATENVLKSVIALRKMQHAQTLLFSKSGLPESQYSKWISENQNVLDPRAFGFDMMDNEAKRKLVTHLGKDPKAYKKFEDSLTFAKEADLIEPPVKK